MPCPSAKAASRIGTAPFSPPQATKARSPCRSRVGSSSGQTTSGRITNASTRREQQARRAQRVAAERRDRDRQPERDEDDDLGQRRERVVEDLALGLERRADVADEQAGDEDGEEARAVARRRRRRRSTPGAGERAQRVEARRSAARRASVTAPSSEPAGDADGEPDRHLRARTRARRSRRCRPGASASSIIPIISAIPTGSFAPDSPCEDRPGAAADLAVAEHREHHRRVGRRDRGAEQAGGGPAEAERRVRDERDRRRRSRTCRRRRARRSARRESRKRRQPIERPPSKRITISATVATRIDGLVRDDEPTGRRPTRSAATTRNGAAAGTEMRSLSLRREERRDEAGRRRAGSPPPKVVTSSTRLTVSRRSGADAAREALRAALEKLLTFPLFTAYLARKYLVSPMRRIAPHPARALALAAPARGTRRATRRAGRRLARRLERRAARSSSR